VTETELLEQIWLLFELFEQIWLSDKRGEQVWADVLKLLEQYREQQSQDYSAKRHVK
jgi:hypothetical protein